MRLHFYISLIILVLFYSCKKDRYEKLYPSVGAVANIDVSILDSNDSKPLEGIPVFVSVFRAFGDYQQFGPFNSDKQGKVIQTINLDRKSDSISFVVNIATKPFQDNWTKVWDSTKLSFKYSYFEQFATNDNEEFKKDIKLSPLGMLRFKSSGAAANTDSFIIRTQYENFTVKKKTQYSKTFKLVPSRIHQITIDFYTKGVKTTYVKDIYVSNIYNLPKGSIQTYELK